MKTILKILPLIGLVLALSCSKQNNPPLKELGDVELTDHEPDRFDLGAGKTCIITPTVRADGKIELSVVIEVVEAGVVRRYTKPGIIAGNSQHVTIAAGDIGIGLRPELKGK